jgi:hypothetical protein
MTGLYPGGTAAEARRWPPTPMQRQGQRNRRAIPTSPFCAIMACHSVKLTSVTEQSVHMTSGTITDVHNTSIPPYS